ncbi:MAG: DNA polymerase III subunit gamma/tau [Victivallaceae bacterium]|jgi:DNA polymerase-3 subunit gamma/tau
MGEYQVIARKWRPQRFADVVGQEHIVQTLKNAIKQQRTAHAYLFVGPRGIGKTTTARIFAKAMNCTAPEDGEPCCRCQSCLSIADESNIDVIEIDAASQNSVDNIRDLRDEVMHVPINGKYKIYIIDEVHMLSKQAWNALLKTVEEPPPHVKFIFATTEVHMVLPTIISRCQRFDLQRISTKMIADRLNKIAAAENVKISKGAIDAIARAADGGMRDAQSLLDQMIAFFSTELSTGISEEQVLSLFGLTAADDIQALIKAMLENDRGGVVASIFNLASRGKNLETLFSDVLYWLRGIQLSMLLSNAEVVLETDQETIECYRRLGNSVRPEVVQILLENLAPVGRILHDALNKQVFLETIIMKSMREAHSIRVEHLIERLNYIRKAGELEVLDKVPPLSAVPLMRTVEIPAAAPLRTVSIPESPEVKITPPPVVVKEAPAVPVAPAPAAPVAPPAPVAAEPVQPPQVVRIEPEPAETEPPEMAYAEPLAEVVPEDSETQEFKYEDSLIPEETPVVAEEPAVIAKPAEAEKPVFSGAVSAPELWHNIIQKAKISGHVDPMVCDFLSEGTAETYQNGILTVSFDEEFDPEHFLQVQQKALPYLMRLLQKTTGNSGSTIILTHEAGIKHIEEPAGKKKKSMIGVPEVVGNVRKNEFVKIAVDLFEGEIVDIHG